MATTTRDAIDREGNAVSIQTYRVDGSTITYEPEQKNGSSKVNKAVKIATAGPDSTVALTTAGSQVLGKLLKVEPDGGCSVEVGGYMRLPLGTGASATVGRGVIGATGASSAPGFVKPADPAVLAEVAAARGWIDESIDSGTVLVKL